MMDIKNTTLDDLAAVIGFCAALRLSAWFGDCHPMHVSAVAEDGQLLVRLIGPSAASHFSRTWGGQQIAVPRITQYENDVTKHRISRLHQKGFSSMGIARDFYISARRVHKYLLNSGRQTCCLNKSQSPREKAGGLTRSATFHVLCHRLSSPVRNSKKAEMSLKQCAKLRSAAAVQNLRISSRDAGRFRFRVGRADGPSTSYFRLDGLGKFTRASGCEAQALQVELLLASVLDQAGNAARASCTKCVQRMSIDRTCSGCSSSVPSEPVRLCNKASALFNCSVVASIQKTQINRCEMHRVSEFFHANTQFA